MDLFRFGTLERWLGVRNKMKNKLIWKKLFYCSATVHSSPCTKPGCQVEPNGRNGSFIAAQNAELTVVRQTKLCILFYLIDRNLFLTYVLSSWYNNTVEPPFSWHPRNKEKCPLNRSVHWREVGSGELTINQLKNTFYFVLESTAVIISSR